MFEAFTPSEYIKIDVAGSFGLDKETWQTRIDWFDANEPELLKALEPGDDSFHPLLFKADKGALVHAGMVSWKAFREGRPCGIPISLDATASGFQFLSAMSGCRTSATTCNVVDNGLRNDAYTAVYQEMKSISGTEARFERKDTKQAVMTKGYGSEAVPREVFGEELLPVFEEAIGRKLPGAIRLNEEILSLVDRKRTVYEWYLPDGFNVRAKVMDVVTRKAFFREQAHLVTFKANKAKPGDKGLGANTVHSLDGMVVREIARRAMHDPARVAMVRSLLDSGSTSVKGAETESGYMVSYLCALHTDSGFLSARILDHVDRDTVGLLTEGARQDLFWLLATLPERPFQVASVHDCFRVLPNHGNALRLLYNVILSDLARSNIWAFLKSQLTGKDESYEKQDAELWRDVLETNYALS